jgi:hypothetical protein
MIRRTVGFSLLALFLTASTLFAESGLPAPDAGGWIPLFNGTDLAGWSGDPGVWRVENGYISGKAAKVEHNTFLICDRAFTNFILEAKVMLIPAGGFGNSGIQYRSRVYDAAQWIAGGYQADVGEGWWGALYEERGRGVLFKASPEAAAAVKANDWNRYEITARGTTVAQTLNGVACGELNDTNAEARRADGVIALQYHAPGNLFEVRFKDIRIKILPP